MLNFVDEVGPRLYIDKSVDKDNENWHFVETEKVRKGHRIIGLFFAAAWSDPCMIWGHILKTLQKELNEGADFSEEKLLKIIIVPMSNKQQEKDELGKMCLEWQMPMIPFDESYAI